MIERLNRERHGHFRMPPPHAGVRDARAHLNQAVEAPTGRPGPRPPIGVEADIYEAGRQAAAPAGVKTEAIESAGAVAVQEDIRLRKECLEGGAVLCLMKIEARTPLAE